VSQTIVVSGSTAYVREISHLPMLLQSMALLYLYLLQKLRGRYGAKLQHVFLTFSLGAMGNTCISLLEIYSAVTVPK